MKKREDNNTFVAIPSAITYFEKVASYSNAPDSFYTIETSEPLGFFLVRPIKEFKIRKEYGVTSIGMVLTGYSEIITGKRIITNTMRQNSFGGMDACFHDVQADITPKIGNVSWQIKTLEEAKELIGKSKIEEYLGCSRKAILEEIKIVHDFAQAIGEENKGKVFTKK